MPGEGRESGWGSVCLGPRPGRTQPLGRRPLDEKLVPCQLWLWNITKEQVGRGLGGGPWTGGVFWELAQSPKARRPRGGRPPLAWHASPLCVFSGASPQGVAFPQVTGPLCVRPGHRQGHPGRGLAEFPEEFQEEGSQSAVPRRRGGWGTCRDGGVLAVPAPHHVQGPGPLAQLSQ